jgi:hypothetical protein
MPDERLAANQYLEGGAGRHGVGHQGSVMPTYDNQIRRVID